MKEHTFDRSILENIEENRSTHGWPARWPARWTYVALDANT